MTETSGLGRWLKERCQEEHLSLRRAGDKTGLSHSTIQAIINGGRASPETIDRLAHGFGGNHTETTALGDELFILAGYRTKSELEVSQPLARLIDIMKDFSQPQLKVMSAFATYLAEVNHVEK